MSSLLLQRYISESLSILQEGRKERYMDMFKDIEPFLPPGTINLKDAIINLKKDDRIVWYLLRLKVWFIGYILDRLKNDEKGRYFDLSSPEVIEKLINEKRRILSKLGSQSAYSINNISSILEEIKHYLSLPIAGIQNYVFKPNTDWFETRYIFIKLEHEWKHETQGKIKHSEYEGKDWKPLINFPDGKVWILLNQSSCSLEARAMGHCGNAGDPRSGDRILSLRTLKNNEWEVHLTFILDKDGLLGEMKGRGNDKPSSKYHPYIVKLLEDPIVRGIKGGGYLEENNFSLSDLPDEEEERLVKEKSGLGGYRHFIYLLKSGQEIPEDNPYIEIIEKELINNGRLKGRVSLSKDNRRLILKSSDLLNIFRGQLTANDSDTLEYMGETLIKYYLSRDADKLAISLKSIISKYKDQFIRQLEEEFIIKKIISKNKIINGFVEFLMNDDVLKSNIITAVRNWINNNSIILNDDGSASVIIDLVSFLNNLSINSLGYATFQSFAPYKLQNILLPQRLITLINYQKFQSLLDDMSEFET